MTPDFNPYDPYGYREEIPGWEKMTDEEREQAAHTHLLCGCATYAIGFAVILLLCWLFSSCTTTKYVAVPQQHTEHHWHTDTVRQTDSIIDHRTTLIREVDSATMARYGIQIKDMQRAWLIETERMQRELSQLRQTKTDTVMERDSIPYPVEVVKEVARPLSWWQSALIYFGAACLLLLIGFIIIKIKKMTEL